MASESKKINFSESALRELEERTINVVKFNVAEESKYFVDIIWPKIEANGWLKLPDPSVVTRIQKLKFMNSFVLLSNLPNNQIIGMFSDQIGWYFSPEVMDNLGLWDKLKGKLVLMAMEERDKFKEEIRQALLGNTQVITSKKIERNEKSYQPTIHNWLVDYTSVVGVGKINPVAVNNYFVTNKNCQNLTNYERGIVRELVNFYERLKRSSFEPEGLEEDAVIIDENNEIVIFSDGRFEKLNPKIEELSKQLEDESAPQSPAEKKTVASSAGVASEQGKEILAAYQGDEKQKRNLARAEKKITKKFKDDISKLRAEFFKSVQAKDVSKTIVILRVLAQKQDLEKFLKEDERLFKFLSVTWEKQYGHELAAEFQKNPGQLKFVRLFLQYVLQQRLAIPRSDAARIGMQIGNIMSGFGKQEYKKMAYFEVSSKTFNWFED